MKHFNLTERLFEDEPGDAGGGGTEVETPETPETENPETPESDDEPALPEEDLSEAEVAESKNLYKLLKDPKTKDLVLTALAQKAGLLSGKQEVETRADVKAGKAEVLAILEESLGDQFKFLAKPLGVAIEKILEQERESNQQNLGRLEATQIGNETQSVLNKLRAETKGASSTLEGKMAALAQKFPAGPDLSVEEYVRGLYAMASSGQQRAPAGRIAERINRNSRDVPSRLHSASGAGKDSPQNLPKMNINQAIDHAMKKLGYKDD